ncbi:MAG: hypothetical protein R3Y04_02290 [Rikenellaceae bacterium]
MDNNKVKQKRVSPKSEVLRPLYAKSGNKCAFPGCNAPIFEDNGLYTGECCHIESYSPNGPRFNSSTTINEKNSYSNLVLMCSRHHTVIDSDVNTYTVEKLKLIKSEHENQYTEDYRGLNDSMLAQIETQVEAFYNKLQLIDKKDTTGLKMSISFGDNLEDCIKYIRCTIKEILDLLERLGASDAKANDELKKYLKLENVDLSTLKYIESYKNPFANRHWESHNLAANNLSSKLQLHINLLEIKILEYMQSKEPKSKIIDKKLELARFEFEELYRNTFYID